MAEERVTALALEYAAVFYATRDRALMPSSEWALCLTAALRTYQHFGLDPEHPPEPDAVGKARECLIRAERRPPNDAAEAWRYEVASALRALGGDHEG